MRDMRPISYIRERVFDLTQAKFAAAIGVTQPTVSRWERGVPMAQTEMEAIRKLAFSRDIAWDDRWFFEVPVEGDHAGPATCCPENSSLTVLQESGR